MRRKVTVAASVVDGRPAAGVNAPDGDARPEHLSIAQRARVAAPAFAPYFAPVSGTSSRHFSESSVSAAQRWLLLVCRLLEEPVFFALILFRGARVTSKPCESPVNTTNNQHYLFQTQIPACVDPQYRVSPRMADAGKTTLTRVSAAHVIRRSGDVTGDTMDYDPIERLKETTLRQQAISCAWPPELEDGDVRVPDYPAHRVGTIIEQRRATWTSAPPR